MSAQRFTVVEVNPNDTPGGGGCLCSETRNPDTAGPFVVFSGTEMESNISPFPVLCAGCATAAAAALDGEVLIGGEAVPDRGEPLEGTAVEIPPEPVEEEEDLLKPTIHGAPEDDEVPRV